jgi:hypothetical protein
VEVVDNETYDIYIAGGWCAAVTSGTTVSLGNSLTASTLAYVVSVKVKWGPYSAAAAGSGTSVILTGDLPTNPAWVAHSPSLVPPHPGASGCPTVLT